MTREEKIGQIQKQLTQETAGPFDRGPLLQPHFLKGAEKAPLIVICPGGGYTHTSERESGPVARAYNKEGFHCLVLRYRVAPHKYPAALTDLSNTVALCRAYAEELGICENRIIVCGFSAGGHLAANLGVHWDKPDLMNTICREKGANRPDALILCYPVILTAGRHAHTGSFENLTGTKADPELQEHLSLEKHISSQVPPVFLWHTQADQSVPVENSLLFAEQLQRHGITFELHIYPFGRHGASLATKETEIPEEKRYADPHVATWLKLSSQWLSLLF